MYYPKSQVKPNLYTNGGEYVLSTNQEDYVGYYFETSTGKRYTEKYPSNSSIELIPFNSSFGITGPTSPNNVLQTNPTTPETIILPIATSGITSLNINNDQNITYASNNDTFIYSSTFNTKPRAIPQFGLTYPTDQEKERGIFTRYFCKKNNELKYLEITAPVYNRLANRNDNIAWDLYTAISVPWKIKGNSDTVFSANESTVNSIEIKNSLLAFSQYFKNKFLQYYVGE
jgi:hypothetical protein